MSENARPDELQLPDACLKKGGSSGGSTGSDYTASPSGVSHEDSSLTSGPDSPQGAASGPGIASGNDNLEPALRDSGLLEQRGEMTNYVVEDLTEKIRAAALRVSVTQPTLYVMYTVHVLPI